MNRNAVAALAAIEVYLPERVETGQDLLTEFPDWPVAKIEQKTGIVRRHIAAPGETASDLAIKAARKLFDSGICSAAEIDFILFCTQTPDYLVPTTACVIQDRLGIPTTAGAIDFNQGSSGFVYGLALAQSMIERGHVRNVLLLTGDTYTRLIHRADKSVRTLFGDGAAATLIRGVDEDEPRIGPFVFGSDGRGAGNLTVPASGMRRPRNAETTVESTDSSGNVRTPENLFMDGGEIFSFTLSSIPVMLRQLYERSGVKPEDVDLFVFHQPNRYMLDTIRKHLKIPAEKFYIHLEESGNTVSATIPLALHAARKDGTLRPGVLVLLAGFGAGYSWSATLVRWNA